MMASKPRMVLWLHLASGWLLVAPATAQDPPPEPTVGQPALEPAPLATLDFEGDATAASWTASDAEATFSITHEKPNVAAGQGALEFAYTARPGVFQHIYTTGFGAAEANALSVKLKATSPTAVSLGVQEVGGAQYQGLLWVAGDTWVTVRTRLDDLILTQDTSDDNGQPDGDQVVGFFLADLANLGGEVGLALGRKEGEQKLWIDDLALTNDASVRSKARAESLVEEWLLVLDDFESDTVWALPVRQAGLELVKGAPHAAGDRGLKLTYTLGLGRWVGAVIAPPGRLDFAAATKYRMWAKTELNARLVVVLEERDGTRYDAAVKTPPDGTWREVVIPIEDFAPADAGADENGQLDTDQINRVIILVDTFDADVRPGGVGSVVLDDVGLIVPTLPEGQPAG